MLCPKKSLSSSSVSFPPSCPEIPLQHPGVQGHTAATFSATTFTHVPLRIRLSVPPKEAAVESSKPGEVAACLNS